MFAQRSTGSGLSTQRWGAILRIELHDPPEPGAAPVSYEELGAAINEGERDRTTRVLLIHGLAEGLRGADLRAVAPDATGGEASAGLRLHLFRAIAQATKPIVASAQGSAVGTGAVVLLHCDLVYAAPDTRFRLPFVDLESVPEGGASYLFGRAAGRQRAAAALLLGHWVDVETMQQLGFVTGVVASEQLLEVATDAARALSEKSGEALRATKWLLKRGTTVPLASAMAAELREMAALRSSP
jgi:enoyl-CoA hydratase/carnithine racemase